MQSHRLARKASASTLLLGAMLFLAPLSVAAQTSDRNAREGERVNASTSSIGSSPPTSGGCRTGEFTPIGAQLPIPVLDYLSRASRSAFVHAYVIRYVAEHGARGNHIADCARKFLETPLFALEGLRAHEYKASEIIEALRVSTRSAIVSDSLRVSIGNKLLPRVEVLYRTTSPFSEISELQSALQLVRQDFDTSLYGECRDRSGRNVAACKALSEVGASTQRLTEIFLAVDTLVKAERDRATAHSRRITSLTLRVAAADMEMLLATSDSQRSEVESRRQALRSALDTEGGDTLQIVAIREQLRRRNSSVRPSILSLRTHLEKLQGALSTSDIKYAQGSAPNAAVRATMDLSSVAPSIVVMPAASQPATSIAVALTDFVLERAQTELAYAFLASSELSSKNASKLVVAAFPNTRALLVGLAAPGAVPGTNAIASLPLSVWRASLVSDYEELPLNLLGSGADVLCQQKDLPTRVRCATRARSAGALVALARSTRRQQAALSIVQRFPDEAQALLDSNPRTAPLGAGIAVVATLAQALQVQGLVETSDPQGHPYVLSSNSLLHGDSVQTAAFMRLLVLRAGRVIDNFAGADSAAMTSAVGSAVSVLEQLVFSAPVSAGEGGNTRFDQQLMLRGAIAGAEIASSLLADSLLQRATKDWRAVAAVFDAVAKTDYSLALVGLTAYVRGLTDTQDFSKALPLISLGAALADATNEDEVRAAFESVAARPGGWRRRRMGLVHTSISAFPGVARGEESLLGTGDPQRTDSWGATLPIGFDFTILPLKRKAKPDCLLYMICSIGLFVPVIDLGTVLQYRMHGSDSISTVQNASLRQFISPGAHLSVGLIQGLPTTLLIGAQLLPALRSDASTAQTRTRSATRFGVALVLDIPLFEWSR